MHQNHAEKDGKNHRRSLHYLKTLSRHHKLFIIPNAPNGCYLPSMLYSDVNANCSELLQLHRDFNQTKAESGQKTTKGIVIEMIKFVIVYFSFQKIKTQRLRKLGLCAEIPTFRGGTTKMNHVNIHGTFSPKIYFSGAF